MEWKQPYFLWNNRETFARGQAVNLQISEEGLALSEGKETGSYFTRICDSRQADMEWDRLRIEGEIPYPKAIQISIYACNENSVIIRKHSYDLQELLCDPAFDMEEKERLLEQYKCRELFYEKEQPLQGVRGRYFWIRLRFHSSGTKSPQVHRIQVWFPKKSWCDFLPELYQMQENSFLERFLGIVQSMYEDMNRRIEEIPGLYYAETAPSELLVWLSQWLTLPEPYLWKEEQLRYLIRRGSELANLRGTAAYLREILWLYTGTEPYIIEYWQWAYEKMNRKRRNAMEQLYGSDSFCVTLVFPQQAVQNQASLAILERLVEQCSPAHLDIRIEILQPYIFLGRHSYLEINSYLKDWSAPVLDGQQFLPFVVLKEKEKQYEGFELFSL